MSTDLILSAMMKIEDWSAALEWRTGARLAYGEAKRAGAAADELLELVTRCEAEALREARRAVGLAFPHIEVHPGLPPYKYQPPADWQELERRWRGGVSWSVCGWDFNYTSERGWFFESDTMRGVRLEPEMKEPRSRAKMAEEIAEYISRCVPARVA